MPTRILLTLLILLFSAPAFADNARNHVFMPAPAPFCLPSVVNVCGINVSVPSQSYGNSITLQTPFPYQREPFTVTCAGLTNQAASQQILDLSSVTCTLAKCQAQDVTLCGSVSVPVEGGVVAGQTREETVPADMLIDPQFGQTTFRTKCVGDDNGDPVYAVADDSQVSCNRFACADKVISMCGMNVPLQGGAIMGKNMDMTLSPPFAPDPYTVQCVGSNGKAPEYQVTDSAAVTCTQMPGVQ